MLEIFANSWQIVITMKSTIVEAFFRLKNDTGRVCLRSGLQIQMIPSIRDLKLAQKHQCAAFVQEEAFLLIWDNDPNNIIQRAADLENQLVEISWQNATGVYPKTKKQRRPSDVATKEALLEAGGVEKRQTTYINSFITSLTLILSFAIIGMGFRVLVQETTVDGNFQRLAVLAYTPIQFVISLVSLYDQAYPQTSYSCYSSSCRLLLSVHSNCLGRSANVRPIPNTSQAKHLVD